MARYFFDTSAIVKYYHTEPGTAEVSRIFAEPDRKIAISSIGLVEIQSAIAIKVRSGALDQKNAGIQRGRLMLDVAAGEIEVYRLSDQHLEAAELLIGRAQLHPTDANTGCVATCYCPGHVPTEFA